MFPTVENVVIEAVLETHASRPQGERFEKALGDLLQLTDPDYKVSTTRPVDVQGFHRLLTAFVPC